MPWCGVLHIDSRIQTCWFLHAPCQPGLTHDANQAFHILTCFIRVAAGPIPTWSCYYRFHNWIGFLCLHTPCQPGPTDDGTNLAFRLLTCLIRVAAGPIPTWPYYYYRLIMWVCALCLWLCFMLCITYGSIGHKRTIVVIVSNSFKWDILIRVMKLCITSTPHTFELYVTNCFK